MQSKSDDVRALYSAMMQEEGFGMVSPPFLNRPIFIVGMPACGKSTFGRALARRLNRQFFDLDAYIENRFHTTVSNLFAERGEDGFRRLESVMLREIGEFENVVISTGGGAPCHSSNMDYMLSRGATVWLQASQARLLTRIGQNPEKRPLLAGLSQEALIARLDELYSLRAPVYRRAEIQFATDLLENRWQINKAVDDFMCQSSPGGM